MTKNLTNAEKAIAMKDALLQLSVEFEDRKDAKYAAIAAANDLPPSSLCRLYEILTGEG